MSILSKVTYRFNRVTFKRNGNLRNRKIHPKIYMQSQGTLSSKNNQLKKNKAKGLTLFDFQTYWKATVIKTVPVKNRGTDQWNRNKPTYLQSINLWQRRQEYIMEKTVSSKWCLESWKDSCQSMKLEHSLISYTKINSKWFKNLNVDIRHNTINS